MSTKVCTICCEEKDESEFDKQRRQCKVCRRKYALERQKAYYLKNREVVLERDHRYYLKNREKILESKKKYYSENKSEILEYKKIYYSENSDTIKKYKRSYYSENKEEKLERDRIYHKSPAGKIVAIRCYHNRKAREHSAPCTLTLIQWNKILESQNNKCAICGKKFGKNRKPTKDHIVPVSLGGGLTFENVQALCKPCNSSKCNSLDHSKIVTWENHGITT